MNLGLEAATKVVKSMNHHGIEDNHTGGGQLDIGPGEPGMPRSLSGKEAKGFTF